MCLGVKQRVKLILIKTDSPKMKPNDISFALSVVLHALVPPSKHTGGYKAPQMGSSATAASDLGLSGGTSHSTRRMHSREIIQTVAFLGTIIDYNKCMTEFYVLIL